MTQSAATPASSARDARREAQEVAGPGYAARVLEPSPPAVEEEPWFADDPVAPGDPAPGVAVLSPVSGTTGTTWDAWLADHPEHREWAADRWLGAHGRLPSAPPDLAPTRGALHRLAVYVISPARRRANGKIALRWTRGGFGTPFFGADEQIRVEGTTLVRQRGASLDAGMDAVPIASLTAAAAFVLDGPPDLAWAEGFDVPAAGKLDEPLEVSSSAASFLGDWYGFAYSVLEEVRAGLVPGEVSRLQLWPEHFDAAFDAGTPAGRVTFGASPGDALHALPYLYVLPPAGVTPDSGWNAAAYTGAELGFEALLNAGDQRERVIAFFRERLGAVENA